MPLNDAIRELTEETYKQFQGRRRGARLPAADRRAARDRIHQQSGRPTDMMRLIEKLIANGNAYVAEGHVLFDVPSMPDYGKLVATARSTR